MQPDELTRDASNNKTTIPATKAGLNHMIKPDNNTLKHNGAFECVLNILKSRSKDCSDERHMIAGDSGATMLKINSHKISKLLENDTKLESCM